MASSKKLILLTSCSLQREMSQGEPVLANSTPGKPAAAPSNDAAGRFYWDTVSRSLFGRKFTSIRT